MNVQAPFTLRGRNPDVLTCIANLSNDEVFTPPQLANQMLDTLAETWAASNKGANIWADKSVKFLDPCTKSGVFLREITTRLTEGLEQEIPDLDERVNHILTRQVFGIGITQITALLARRSVYCSKYANGKHSIAKTFSNKDGNIWFKRMEHSWVDSKCEFCGAPKAILDREIELENYAYAFIHTNTIQSQLDKIFGKNMQFDVIVGNPPYQQGDGGYSKSASPIYHKFVEQAKKLNPRYLSMVIPSRWFAGGKGLDEFRTEMLNDNRTRRIVDFENSSEVFAGVDIAGGVCFFLWNRNEAGLCEVTNMCSGEKVTSKRPLNEFPTFIRNSKSIPIIRKVLEAERSSARLSAVVSASKPFGIRGNYEPKANGIPCWFTQKIGLRFARKTDIHDNFKILDKWKLLIPRAPIAGQTDFSRPVGFYYEGNVRIAKPGECCTESYLVACAFKTREETLSFKSYLFTKTVRFLLLQSVFSQDVTRERFCFIPDLVTYTGTYTDIILRKRWKITNDEWIFIDSKISDHSRDTAGANVQNDE